MDGAKQHVNATTYSNPAVPAEIEVHAFTSIRLEQQLRINELENRIDQLE